MSGPKVVIGLILALSLAGNAYLYTQYDNLKEESAKTTDQKNAELVEKIRKVYELPPDETPVVAVVSDEEKFKQEYPVFTNARKDDYLLLYEKASQAILYRPSENKVIGTANFQVKRGASVFMIASESQQSAIETSINTEFAEEARVSGKGTPSGTYAKTQVIDLSGQYADLSARIAEALGGEVSQSIPVSEKPADGSEIVVIVGTETAEN